jgi:biotin carboxyl carrier protein
MKFEIQVGGAPGTVEISSVVDQPLECVIDGHSVTADVAEIVPGTYSILIGNSAIEVRVEETPAGLRVISPHAEYVVVVRDLRKWNRNRSAALGSEGRQQIMAPMPGKVVRILLNVGDHVEAGQGIMVVEAMKMQNEVRSTKSGTIERLLIKEGQAVAAGQALVIVA